MDINSNCVWKNKKYPEECMHPKYKDEKCHCNLEPCVLYEKYSLLKLLKIKFKNRRKKNWTNISKNYNLPKGETKRDAYGRFIRMKKINRKYRKINSCTPFVKLKFL